MGLFSWMGRTLGGRSSDAEDSHSDTEERGSSIDRRVPAGFRYLRPNAVLQLERFQSAQEFIASGGGVFHPEDQIPALVIFVSHRWESRFHPDPTGHQLRALQYVLRYIPEVAALLNAPASERLRRLPSIRLHGAIHAALLLGSTDTSDEEDNVWREWARVVEESEPTKLLEHIGIWYDYSCMHQATGGSDKWARGKMFENLTQLPDLVRASAIFILREGGDDYSERGWCAAEIAAARKDNQLIVLRMDLLGKGIRDSDLTSVDADSAKDDFSSFYESASLFRSPLDKWESKEVERVNLWGLYVGFRDIKIREESRKDPLLTTKRNPDAFPQQKAILLFFIETLAVLSATDKRDGGLREPLDLADTLREVMASLGLKCTEDWDVVFVGLSIMRSRHHPKLVPSIEELYRTAIERWIKGESVKLVRYREKRETMAWEAWYLFEGEEPTARRKPRWAR
jgi:hypothetical protein